MSSNKFMKHIAVAVTAFAAATAAHAAPVVFFGENQAPANIVSGAPLSAHNTFLSHLTPAVGTENFESLVVGAIAPLNIAFPGSSGNITATITGDGEVRNTSSVGRFNTTGATVAPAAGKWWNTSSDFTIDFSSPISAFGFYGTDIGDFEGQVTVALMDENGGITDLTIGSTINSANGSLLFWGFYDTSTAYTRISFGNTNANTDFFGFDDMVVGDLGQIKQIPEPATLLLAGLGLVGLATTRRKQRH